MCLGAAAKRFLINGMSMTASYIGFIRWVRVVAYVCWVDLVRLLQQCICAAV